MIDSFVSPGEDKVLGNIEQMQNFYDFENANGRVGAHENAFLRYVRNCASVCEKITQKLKKLRTFQFNSIDELYQQILVKIRSIMLLQI